MQTNASATRLTCIDIRITEQSCLQRSVQCVTLALQTLELFTCDSVLILSILLSNERKLIPSLCFRPVRNCNSLLTKQVNIIFI